VDLDITEAGISIHSLSLKFMDEREPLVVGSHSSHQVYEPSLIHRSSFVDDCKDHLDNICDCSDKTQLENRILTNAEKSYFFSVCKSSAIKVFTKYE
jgi:hypothetical protein